MGYLGGFKVTFEKIFEEMLGDRNKLPELTKWVIGFSRWIQGNILIILAAAIGIFVLWQIVKAMYGWYMKSRIFNWYPQLHAIERGLPDSTLPQLRLQRRFLQAVVDQVSAAVGERGGRLVLLGADSPDAGAGGGAQEPEVFSGVGLRAELVADVLVREDEHVLVTRPKGTDPLPVRVWLAPAD